MTTSSVAQGAVQADARALLKEVECATSDGATTMATTLPGPGGEVRSGVTATATMSTRAAKATPLSSLGWEAESGSPALPIPSPLRCLHLE